MLDSPANEVIFVTVQQFISQTKRFGTQWEDSLSLSLSPSLSYIHYLMKQ